MKKRLRYFVIALSVIAIAWTVLTIYVERKGPAAEWNVGSQSSTRVLIVYDPDPFYNLDEKVCRAFASGLAHNNISVKVATVAAAEGIDQNNYQAFIYCANTYNWRPDWAIVDFIEERPNDSRTAVTITLGAGSTEVSQKHLDEVVKNTGLTLINSYSLWLWRPNDETKIEKSNVELAESMAYQWGNEIGKQLIKL